MSWVTICQDSDLPANAGIAALVNGHQIAVFKVKDHLYAMDNFDPICRANILSRGIIGCIGEELCVASPLYKQHYSLGTGRCLEEEGMRISTYPIREQNGKVQIDSSYVAVTRAA